MFMVCLLVLISCTTNPDLTNGIIVFDYNKSYPEIDIKLSDVADVKFIKMGGINDGYLISSRHAPGNDLFIDTAKGIIYTLQKKRIYAYDMEGNPLRELSRAGLGPQEYKILSHFWVNTDKDEIYCYDSNRLVVYDTLFNFKRSIKFSPPFLKNFTPIGNDTLLAYSHLAFRFNDPAFPHSYFLLAIEGGDVIKPYNITFEREGDKMEMDNGYFLYYQSLVEQKDGVLMVNKYCDTVFKMEYRTKEVTPYFVDKTNYGSEECMAIPSFDIDKYFFFNVHSFPRLSPDIESRYYAYDKEKREIFRIKAKIYERLFNIIGLVNNQCTMNSIFLTMTKGYAAVYLSVIELQDNIDELPADLRAMAETMDENDNPILMLIKFK